MAYNCLLNNSVQHLNLQRQGRGKGKSQSQFQLNYLIQQINTSFNQNDYVTKMKKKKVFISHIRAVV